MALGLCVTSVAMAMRGFMCNVWLRCINAKYILLTRLLTVLVRARRLTW